MLVQRSYLEKKENPRTKDVLGKCWLVSCKVLDKCSSKIMMGMGVGGRNVFSDLITHPCAATSRETKFQQQDQELLVSRPILLLAKTVRAL